jgi:hypothetical protein
MHHFSEQNAEPCRECGQSTGVCESWLLELLKDKLKHREFIGDFVLLAID